MKDITHLILDFRTKCILANVEPSPVLVSKGWRRQMSEHFGVLFSCSFLARVETDCFGLPVEPDWDAMIWGIKIRFV